MCTETQIGSRLPRIFDLTGKIAIVTGSAQELGAATARLFVKVEHRSGAAFGGRFEREFGCTPGPVSKASKDSS